MTSYAAGRVACRVLAMMTHAGHTIAAGLLGAYLGGDAGRRVHAGAVGAARSKCPRCAGCADVRGFAAIADTTPGLMVIELLDAIFETLPLHCPRGCQARKFLCDWQAGEHSLCGYDAG
jgi:adenylate cyclase